MAEPLPAPSTATSLSRANGPQVETCCGVPGVETVDGCTISRDPRHAPKDVSWRGSL